MDEKNRKHGLTSPHGGDTGGGGERSLGATIGSEGDEVAYIDDAEKNVAGTA
jgi:hypothetical protein